MRLARHAVPLAPRPVFFRAFLDVLEFMALGFMAKDRDLYDVT